MTQQTILVVDDEAPMRRLIASNLKVSGYDVHTAVDGTEALKLIDEHPFDLLLLDIGLPGPDGLQVLEAIRRELKMSVLMLSGRLVVARKPGNAGGAKGAGRPGQRCRPTTVCGRSRHGCPQPGTADGRHEPCTPRGVRTVL